MPPGRVAQPRFQALSSKTAWGGKLAKDKTEQKWTVAQIIELLEQEYGPRQWHSRNDPVSELVQTLLSQNTSDVNSGRAFSSLKAAFPRWESLAEAEESSIEAIIRPGGLARIKAARIKAVLQQILRQRGSLYLGFLKDMPLAEAKAWLRLLPGVGPKTAACVLLFALGMPALPVDTHVYRVARRLGLLGERASVEQAHQVLEAQLPAQDVYRFHVYLIEHGRKICKAPTPLCHRCVLNPRCPSSLV